MSERKNIDKLFQEGFKEFEVEPAAIVWQNIEEKLKEKKKRRVIPFWWKFTGIAATLLLGFFIADGIIKSNHKIENNLVIQEKPDGNSKNNTDLNQINSNEKVIKNEIILTLENKKTRKNNSNNAIAIINNNDNSSNLKVNESVSKTNKQDAKIAFIAMKNKRNHSNHEKINQGITSSSENKNDAVTTTKNEKNEEQKNENFDLVSNQKTTTVSSEINNQNSKAEDSKNTNKVVSENEPLIKKLDSTAVATVVPNALEELLHEKENNLVKKEPELNRWQITSNVAPIYFGSTTNGSPIDSTFAGNSKEYNNNIGFGLGVSYALSSKIKIRTGVNKVSLNYNTNDVVFYSSLQRNSNSLDNVNLSAAAQNMFIGTTVIPSAVTSEFIADNTESTFEGYLNQKMGYVEVPLELSYAIIDKKFGITIIGGISTLFLNENKILMVSNNRVSDIGEANNLNKTHFSTNIGLGIKYNIIKDFQVHFEPMFKHQMKTFSKDDGNFKPYFFGLYSGVSYNF